MICINISKQENMSRLLKKIFKYHVSFKRKSSSAGYRMNNKKPKNKICKKKFENWQTKHIRIYK